MSQPTWEDFQRLENELKEEVRKLREQITEPIKITRIEVASEDVLKRLESMDQKLDRIDQQQAEHAKGLFMHSRSIGALQEEVKGARADILQIRESQADLRDAIKKTATKEDLSKLETRMATKDDISELKDLILQLIQQRPKE